METTLYESGNRHPRQFNPAMNAGLWFDKFPNQWHRDFLSDPDKFQESNDRRRFEKLEWINTVVGKQIGDTEQLIEYGRRIRELLKQGNGKLGLFENIEPFVAGLGRDHPVENGFTWHPTLGTPFLPGSSLKGLVRDYVHEWIDPDDPEKPDEVSFKRIFGSETKSDRARVVGSIIFFDLIPTAPVNLKADILTPHYTPYYAASIGNEADDDKTADDVPPPGDWIDPTPIPFLVVKPDQLFFCGIAPRRLGNTEDEKDCDAVFKWLNIALECLGAGAKTANGYGSFRPMLEKIEELEIADTAFTEKQENLRKRKEGKSDLAVSLLDQSNRENWNNKTMRDSAFVDSLLQQVEEAKDNDALLVLWELMEQLIKKDDLTIMSDPLVKTTVMKKGKPAKGGFVFRPAERENANKLIELRKRLEPEFKPDETINDESN